MFYFAVDDQYHMTHKNHLIQCSCLYLHVHACTTFIIPLLGYLTILQHQSKQILHCITLWQEMDRKWSNKKLLWTIPTLFLFQFFGLFFKQQTFELQVPLKSNFSHMIFYIFEYIVTFTNLARFQSNMKWLFVYFWNTCNKSTVHLLPKWNSNGDIFWLINVRKPERYYRHWQINSVFMCSNVLYI